MTVAFRIAGPVVCLVLLIAAWMVMPSASLAQEDQTTVSHTIPSGHIPDYRLPDEITLCGERFPLDKRDVYERMDYEFLLALHSRLQIFLWLRRADRYFPYIEKELAAAGLPEDIKYLAVAESDLRPSVRSIAGAMGVWQFMKFTGRKYGLRTDKDFDERKDFEQATGAAVKYLARLHDMFGKWTLAMAAYNCGEGCVGKAIREQGVKSYFRLDLPRETERYVYRIAAIKLILENPDKYGYAMDPDLAYPPLDLDEVGVSLAEEIHITRVAKAIGTDYKVIKELNPWVLGKELPKGSYRLYVPRGLGGKLKDYLASSPANDAPPKKASSGSSGGGSGAASVYTVRRGDTLSKIAARTGVSLDTLRRLNNIHGDTLLVGQKIRLR